MRLKKCHGCSQACDVMYRCRKDENAKWSFYCKVCMENLRKKYQSYQYGGTWKKFK